MITGTQASSTASSRSSSSVNATASARQPLEQPPQPAKGIRMKDRHHVTLDDALPAGMPAVLVVVAHTGPVLDEHRHPVAVGEVVGIAQVYARQVWLLGIHP